MRFFGAALLLPVVMATALAGCSTPAPTPVQRLAPEAPAAASLPPLRPPEEASPLTQKAPFGLYANHPANDTLATLATGALSADNRFRAALTQQGAWVARTDAAWLWQISLPSPPPPPPQPNQPKVTERPAGPAAGPEKPPEKLPVPTAPLRWRADGILVLQDDGGLWYEADPVQASVRPLPTAFKGAQLLTFAPGGKQVLYYLAAGKQLWTAAADGTGAKLQGENVVGSWGPDSKLAVLKSSPPGDRAPATKLLQHDVLLSTGQQRQ